MAVEMSGGHGTPFYDPLYRPGTPTSQSEESVNRWYDDFSVFNHLHLPKSKALSFNASKQILQPVRQGGVVVKCEPQVTELCEGNKAKQATEEAGSQDNQGLNSF
jgi:hypothetical protein